MRYLTKLTDPMLNHYMCRWLLLKKCIIYQHRRRFIYKYYPSFIYEKIHEITAAIIW